MQSPADLPRCVQPLLDVILFTRSLAAVMGYRGQMGLYSYYLLAALVLRRLSPPLALMTAQEAGLSGNFRQAHQVGRVAHRLSEGPLSCGRRVVPCV